MECIIHTEELGNVAILIVPDGRYWFAQGLEVDYAAQGDSVDGAKAQFKLGLLDTVRLHMHRHGNTDRLLKRKTPAHWIARLRAGEQASA